MALGSIAGIEATGSDCGDPLGSVVRLPHPDTTASSASAGNTIFRIAALSCNRHMVHERYRRGHVALERALSKRGMASRSEAQRLVRGGHGTINRRGVSETLPPVPPHRGPIPLSARTPAPPARR